MTVEPFVFWILGSSVGILSAGVGGYINLVQRVTRVEAVLALFGEKAAKILHSPHTPELDSLLEKYISRNYELSFEEWQRLLLFCETIENDKSGGTEERALAAWLSAISHHKLRMPPPSRKMASHAEGKAALC